MSKKNVDQFPSLTRYFEPPADCHGIFGWVCGYSADAVFLDEALERFTRQTKSQRAYDGRVWMALMLDPGNPPIAFADAPGAAHLPILDSNTMPFTLLHAKLALLGFQKTNAPDHWRIRLILSTGNWTRQTVEESLDIAWCIEVDDKKLEGGGAQIAQDCADISAAHSLFMWLTELFDQRLLEGNRGRMAETLHHRAAFDRWLVKCAEAAEPSTTRFFDNRQRSLIDQLSERIETADGSGSIRRNYLAMGSGFYETTEKPGRLPLVPIAIRDKLRAPRLLTRSAVIDLFVNPANCQGIAGAVDQLRDEAGMTVRPALAPPTVFGKYAVRDLHAKFLFSANVREDLEYANSPWVYIGSGNLTGPGFMQAAGNNGGNLETGVVFAPPRLAWNADSGELEKDVVSNLLPIQRDDEFHGSSELSPGADFPDRETIHMATPVAWFFWEKTTDGGKLATLDPIDLPFEVLNHEHNPCKKLGDRHLWLGPRPIEVIVRWPEKDGKVREGSVPVVDELGRIAGTPLPRLDIEAAWGQLSEFPLPTAADDDEGDDEGGPTGDENTSECEKRAKREKPGTYPIRQMMTLVENIAAKQTEIHEFDWPAWCARLEQTLGQATESSSIEAFIELGLNPISPLWAAPFRPDFAESDATDPGKHYENILNRIEVTWGVQGLAAIGSSK